jgi:hypothetical protein
VPITWDVPVEERPMAEIEALSIVLSGDRIDSGEGLSATSQSLAVATSLTAT